MSKELIFKEREITRRSSSYLGGIHPSFEKSYCLAQGLSKEAIPVPNECG
jgi:hypothetical protein